MFLNKILTASVLLLYLQSSLAIDNKWGSPIFNHYTASNGLSDSTVYAIIQDRNGMMWFGAPNGLIRFDGYTFKHYPSAIVMSMTEDRQGYIWSATRGGLKRLDPRTEKSLLFVFDEEDPQSISDNNVYALLESNDGELWVGTGKGLNLYNAGTKKFDRYLSPFNNESNTILSIVQDNNGSLLLGTGGGLIRFERSTKTFELILLDVNEQDPKTKSISSLLLDSPENRLWMTTRRGLVEYQFKNKKSKLHLMKENQERSYSLYKDKRGRLLVGYLGEGLCQFFYESEEWRCLNQKTLPTTANSVTSIHQSPDGVLWLGLDRKGVLSFNLEHPFRLITFDKEHNHISDINMDDQGQLWAATLGGLLKTTKDNQFKKYYHDEKPGKDPKPKEMFYVHISPDKQIWTLAQYDISKYDPLNDRLVAVSILNPKTSKEIIEASQISQVHPSELLITSSTQGLFRWKINAPYAEEINFDSYKELDPDGNPWSLATFVDSNGRIWYFGFRFLAYLDQTSNKLIVTEYYSDPTFFMFMLEDASGQIWALANQSLHKIDANGKTEKRFDNSLFNNASLFSISHTDDEFWIGATNGLWRFDPKTETVQQFDEKDGLQASTYLTRSYVDDQGLIFMGGKSGITVFHPDDIKNMPKIPPRVILTDLLINNKYIDFSDKQSPISKKLTYLNHLQLSHEQSRFFSIEFSALSYLLPSGNQYAYRLEGINDDWIYTDASNRRAVYTALHPGDYTFRVKAANSFDAWNEEGVSLSITILPPWWRTVWAYSIYTAIFIALLFWFIHYRTAQSRLRAAQLEHEVILRTQELQQRTKEIHQQKKTIEELLEKKNTLFANVSHEFRTPLTLVFGPIERMLKRHFDQDSVSDLSLVKRSAQRLHGLVEQLLLFSKLSNFESAESVPCSVKQIIETTGASLTSLMDDHQLQLSIKPIEDIWVKLTPDDALQTILSNLLSNAAKYTPGGGKVSISASTDNSNVHIQVHDNGPGVPTEWQEKIFERFSRVSEHIKAGIPGTGLGLALVKELVEINHGRVSVANADQGGAIFEVVLPIYTPSDDEIAGYSASDLGQTVHDTPVVQLDTPVPAEHDTGKPTLQIIDDTADMRSYLYQELNDEFNVLLSEDGETGLQSIKQQAPDIVICDIMMPGINGLEVLKRLRTDIEISHTPLILLTAKDDKEYRIKGYEEQADDYITKPFATDELKARLHNILNLRKTWQAQAQIDFAKNSVGRHSLVQNYETSEKEFLENFKNVLDQHCQDPDLNIGTISDKLHMSQSSLNRKIKALLGLAPYQYLRIYRLEKAAQILKAGYDGNIAELADAMGFSSQQYFSSSFKEHFGISPKDYSK